MGLETHGSGNIGSENFDGRQLELQAAFDIGGTAELDPQGPDWEAQKLAYGRQVAIQVADRAVPELLSRLGATLAVPSAYRVHVGSDLEQDAGFTPLAEGVVAARQQISGVFPLEGDRDLAPAALISAARDTIGEQVANLAVFALEQHFEHKQQVSFESSLQRRNGEITGYQRTEVPAGEPPLAA